MAKKSAEPEPKLSGSDYVCTIALSVDMGAEQVRVNPGQTLDGVSEGVIQSMIRMGQAITKNEYPGAVDTKLVEAAKPEGQGE